MTCVNCGDEDTTITATSSEMLLSIGRLRVSWVTASSEYCDSECLREYGRLSGEGES